MLSSSFLSMWISNTATAAMMLSIAHAVLQELKERLEEVRLGGEETDEAPPTQTQPAEQGQGRRTSPHDTLVPVGGVEMTTSFSDSVEGALVPPGDSHLDGVLPPGGSNLGGTARNGKPCGPLEAYKGTFDRLSKGLMLGVTYSANVGGIGTLTGTGPNLLLRENAVRSVLS